MENRDDSRQIWMIVITAVMFVLHTVILFVTWDSSIFPEKFEMGDVDYIFYDFTHFLFSLLIPIIMSIVLYVLLQLLCKQQDVYYFHWVAPIAAAISIVACIVSLLFNFYPSMGDVQFQVLMLGYFFITFPTACSLLMSTCNKCGFYKTIGYVKSENAMVTKTRKAYKTTKTIGTYKDKYGRTVGYIEEETYHPAKYVKVKGTVNSYKCCKCGNVTTTSSYN
jgi:uncharacterized paraquat-inducible protein A